MKARRNARPGVEPLEGKALLSHVGAAPRVAALTTHRTQLGRPTTPLTGDLNGQYQIQPTTRGSGLDVGIVNGSGTLDGAPVDGVTGRMITGRGSGTATLTARLGTATIVATGSVPGNLTTSQPISFNYRVTQATGPFKNLRGHIGRANVTLSPSNVQSMQEGGYTVTVQS